MRALIPETKLSLPVWQAQSQNLVWKVIFPCKYLISEHVFFYHFGNAFGYITSLEFFSFYKYVKKAHRGYKGTFPVASEGKTNDSKWNKAFNGLYSTKSTSRQARCDLGWGQDLVSLHVSALCFHLYWLHSEMSSCGERAARQDGARICTGDTVHGQWTPPSTVSARFFGSD